MTRMYEVATFTHYGGKGPRVSKVDCYTLWFNPEWPGCIIYKVEAENGRKAKQAAARMRVAADKAGGL